jgi:hypothetical protein
MAFVFAYTLQGDGADVVTDKPLDTATNYKNAVGTNGVTKGDLVHLASGLLVRSKNVTTPPKAYGVLEGTEFVGLAAGGTYAAVNSSFNANSINTTRNPNGVGKVRHDPNAVYKVPLKAGQTATNAMVGVSYGISQDAAGDQTVDTTQTVNVLVKVEDYSADLLSVFVTLLP